MRALLIGLLLCSLLPAASVKLYLKDGGYQIVREYKVEDGRVRYLSAERGEWEEIPVELVDLNRTGTEAAERAEELRKETEIISRENAAERAQADEVSRIPVEPGAYWLDGQNVHAMPWAQSTLRTSKGRSVLARLSPIPVFAGKATLEIDSPHSRTVFSNPLAEFYLRLSDDEEFGIVRLSVKEKGRVRVVEQVTIIPISKEYDEAPVLVPLLQRQLDSTRLYKIWPKAPLPEGEYAVIQYTPGKMNMQIWDFAIKP